MIRVVSEDCPLNDSGLLTNLYEFIIMNTKITMHLKFDVIPFTGELIHLLLMP